MQLHQLQPVHKMKSRKRVGRGGKRGTYSGRGLKGQLARAGRKLVPSIREFVKKYPKLKGYRTKSGNKDFAVLDVAMLEKHFNAGDVITPEVLMQKRLVRQIKGKTPVVKILSEGDIKKKLTIAGCQVSKIAKEKIEKAKGTIR